MSRMKKNLLLSGVFALMVAMFTVTGGMGLLLANEWSINRQTEITIEMIRNDEMTLEVYLNRRSPQVIAHPEAYAWEIKFLEWRETYFVPNH